MLLVGLTKAFGLEMGLAILYPDKPSDQDHEAIIEMEHPGKKENGEDQETLDLRTSI